MAFLSRAIDLVSAVARWCSISASLDTVLNAVLAVLGLLLLSLIDLVLDLKLGLVSCVLSAARFVRRRMLLLWNGLLGHFEKYAVRWKSRNL